MTMTNKEIFNLLGVKEVTTARQRANGTKVFMLPERDVLSSGQTRPVMFATYSTGYVRKIAPYQMYQINPVRIVETAEWNATLNKVVKCNKRVRVLIKNQVQREEFLVKFILKNHIQKQRLTVSKWTRDTIARQHTEVWQRRLEERYKNL